MQNVVPTLQYVWLTVKHKAFVFRAGLKTRAPLVRLIIHDLSKFSPAEAPHYGRQFFGDKSDPDGFAAAWLHHQNRNPHHWEYWISRTTHTRSTLTSQGSKHEGGEKILPMPEWAVREMVADWMGASRAYGGSWPETVGGWNWLNDNWFKISSRLHPATVQIVENVLREVFGHAYQCLACRDDDNATFGDSLGGSICYDVKCTVCEHVGRTLRQATAA